MNFQAQVDKREAELEAEAAADRRSRYVANQAARDTLTPYYRALPAIASALSRSEQFRHVFGEKAPVTVLCEEGDPFWVFFLRDLRTTTCSGTCINFMTPESGFEDAKAVLVAALYAAREPGRVVVDLSLLFGNRSFQQDGIFDSKEYFFHEKLERQFIVSTPSEVEAQLQEVLVEFVVGRTWDIPRKEHATAKSWLGRLLTCFQGARQARPWAY